VTRTENEEKSMFQWLATVPYHSYDIQEDKPKGYSAIGAAHLNVRRANGQESDEAELDEEEIGSDDDVPKKKAKLEN